MIPLNLRSLGAACAHRNGPGSRRTLVRRTRRSPAGAKRRAVEESGRWAARRGNLQNVLKDELTVRFDGTDCAGVRDDEGRCRGARGRPEHLQEPADGTIIFATLRGQRAAGSVCRGNSRVGNFRPVDGRRAVQVFVEQRMDQMRSHRGKQDACQGEAIDDLRKSTLSCHESPSFSRRCCELSEPSPGTTSGVPHDDGDALSGVHDTTSGDWGQDLATFSRTRFLRETGRRREGRRPGSAGPIAKDRRCIRCSWCIVCPLLLETLDRNDRPPFDRSGRRDIPIGPAHRKRQWWPIVDRDPAAPPSGLRFHLGHRSRQRWCRGR